MVNYAWPGWSQREPEIMMWVAGCFTNEYNPLWHLLDSAMEPRVYIQPEDPGSRPVG